MEGDYLNQLFRISRLNVDDALRIHASPHEPHQHDYETLIIGIQGQLEHFVDFKTTIIEAPLISFIAKGKVHSINTQLVNGQFDVWVLRFKSEFIAETVFQLYASYHNNANHLLQKDTCFDRLSHVCELMNHEMAVPSPDLSVVSKNTALSTNAPPNQPAALKHSFQKSHTHSVPSTGSRWQVTAARTRLMRLSP